LHGGPRHARASPERPPRPERHPLDEHLRAEPFLEEALVEVPGRERILDAAEHPLVVALLPGLLPPDPPRRDARPAHRLLQGPEGLVLGLPGGPRKEVVDHLAGRPRVLLTAVLLHREAELRHRLVAIVRGHLLREYVGAGATSLGSEGEGDLRSLPTFDL